MPIGEMDQEEIAQMGMYLEWAANQLVECPLDLSAMCALLLEYCPLDDEMIEWAEGVANDTE
jgi:hypothetical protein